jgi:outer membrane protein insertion porin family
MGDAYGNTYDIPIYERFFAGGTSTIRGYDERSIGPIDPLSKDPLGGDATFIGNIEYVYPLLDFLKVVAFYDTGNVWKKINDFDTGDLYSGVGFGIRMKTPIGPIAVDYGIPLDVQPGETRKSSGKVHFSMSRSF